MFVGIVQREKRRTWLGIVVLESDSSRVKCEGCRDGGGQAVVDVER